MEARHPHKGQGLGNDWLEFVLDQPVLRSDASDVGVFIDTGRVLKPNERLQLRFEQGMPHDVKRQPLGFDESAWPLECQVNAWRNFSVAYVSGRLY